MKLFQWNVARRYSSSGYVKVRRPDSFKVIEKPTEDAKLLPKALDVKIKAGGPITVADYMKTVLTNPSAGYYMQKNMIGSTGDFVTSPEISQIFGEIVGIWIYYELRKIGLPKPWQLIELGPGKGSLMRDVLRVLHSFKATDDLSVHLVEVSYPLSSLQGQLLCTEDVIGIGMIPNISYENPYYKMNVSHQDVPIYWYEKLEKVPNAFSVILAHEFFDALPIHKFQKVKEGEWREILINSISTETDFKFEYVLSKKETPMSKLLIRKDETREHVEICPEGGALAKHIADRLEEFGGISLIMDYGHNGEKTDTFRGFKKHKLHDPLVSPGSADLTADVDFSFLREVMKDKLYVCGPVEQGDFLHKMGIKTRLEQLQKSASQKEGKNLESAYHTMVDPDKMGSRYKFFSAFPLVLEEHLKKYPVGGFS